MILQHIFFLITFIIISYSYEISSEVTCRDRKLWPFSQNSIWNMPIGKNAAFAQAHLFQDSDPTHMFGDDDIFISASPSDPKIDFVSQGWWGHNKSHCEVVGEKIGWLRFPKNFTFPKNLTQDMGGNNAAALLMEDRETLVQFQPFYRCYEDSPILGTAWHFWKGQVNESILGEGITGAHSGSGLSSIGGTLRLGELSNDSKKIQHALKIELSAHHYYYGGSEFPCFRWPASNCDNYAHDDKNHNRYNGTNPFLTPGSLLAVPHWKTVNAKTIPGQKLFEALQNYGGYIVDDSAADRMTLCTEAGLQEQFLEEWGYDFKTKSGDFYDDMRQIFKKLEIVTNNFPGSIGGGGEPIAPLAPPICI